MWYFFEGVVQLICLFFQEKYDMVGLRSSVAQFLPLESMSNLIEQPFTRLNVVQSAANQIQADVLSDYTVYFHEIAIVSIWTFLFIYASLLLLKKRDL